MIKFTDVCKAYVRYWYVILICLVLVTGVVLGVTTDKTTYTAKSTLVVDKNDKVDDNSFITSSYATTIIREMDMIINHKDFARMIIDEVNKTDTALANKLDVNTLHKNLGVSYDKKDSTFFTLTYIDDNDEDAKTVVDVATDLIIKEQTKKDGTKAKLTKVYSTEININASKRMVYAVIGVLIGIVLGIVLVTFFVVFNPYVENEDLLAKETGVAVLASLTKARGENDEERENN